MNNILIVAVVIALPLLVVLYTKHTKANKQYDSTIKQQDSSFWDAVKSKQDQRGA